MISDTDTGFVDILEGFKHKLKEEVVTVATISFTIDASQQSFQFYSQGVYDEKECSYEQLYQRVLVVGYGTDAQTEKDIWIFKNCWGTELGD